MAVDFQKLLGQVAPWLAAAATGNIPALVAMSANAIGDAVGVNVKPTVDAIGAAINGASPEQMLAIKSADNEFALKMQALGFQDIETLQKIAADDRASARAREIAVKDSTPRNLAYLLSLAFFGALACMIFVAIPEGNKDVMNVMLGSLGTAWLASITYYFGTTQASSRKTEIMAQQAYVQ